MGKSILQDNADICLHCGHWGTEEHHVFFGPGNRKLSTKYGMLVYLCPECHRGTYGVHGGNIELDLDLKKMAQEKFQLTYNEDFVSIFGRNYL